MPKPPSERRHHVVFITCNTEYHCRGKECVGVRDRESGRWQRAHPALRTPLLGAIHSLKAIYDRKKPSPVRPPQTGLRLLFGATPALMTSPVVMEARPDRESIFYYTSLCRSGEIPDAA